MKFSFFAGLSEKRFFKRELKYEYYLTKPAAAPSI